ncbi:TPA: hypothetical protein ACSTL0_004449 [Serratia fonticola]
MCKLPCTPQAIPVNFETAKVFFKLIGFIVVLNSQGDIKVTRPETGCSIVLDKIILQATHAEFLQIAQEVGFDVETIKQSQIAEAYA